MISDHAENGGPARAFTRAPATRVLAGARSGPTVLRIALGTHLRRLREASNLTTEQAAEAIRATHSKISRLERGRSAAKQRDVADLLSLYGVTDEAEREALLALTRQASVPGWWQQYTDVLPRWLELYIGLEKAAFLYVGDVYGDPDFSEEFELTEGEHASILQEVPSEQEAEDLELRAREDAEERASPPEPPPG